MGITAHVPIIDAHGKVWVVVNNVYQPVSEVCKAPCCELCSGENGSHLSLCEKAGK